MNGKEKCELFNEEEAKGFCWKMQKAGLSLAVEELCTSNKEESKAILRSLIHSLETYQCIPCEKLLERLKWTLKEVENTGTNFYEGTNYTVRMLAEELEALIEE